MSALARAPRMERFMPLLLDLWREACRHIEIADAVERMAPLLLRKLPADLLLVRRLDLPRGGVETRASSGTAPETLRNEVAPEELEELAAWCRAGKMLHRPAASVMRELPGLLPPGLHGDVLAGPLAGEEEPAGALVLVAERPRRFGREHEAMLRALLDPFAVALENDRRLRELETLREAAEADRRTLLSRLGRQDLQETIVGAEDGLRPCMERVELVASSDVPVLLLGETGSGKEVVARAIHARSRRVAAPFLRVNCGAIPAGLIDSELFGHERGSFTGAANQRKGWFERADGGTLFLDEVGELPPDAQVRLLRILQDGSFERVGGQRTLHADVRIVAATNRDLHAMVVDARFREDLWYRLAVFPIHLPPLRDRSEDIPALANHFALRAATRFGTPPLVPSPADLDLLLAYAWPGNVRELIAVMERAVLLGNGRTLEVATSLGSAPRAAAPAADEPRPARPSSPATPRTEAAPLNLDAAMASHIENALAKSYGRIEGPHGAARLLGINPHTLRARMRKLGIDWRRHRLRAT